MGVYPMFLAASALIGALGSGFLLAQAPRERSTQLSAVIAFGAAWWSMCESFWNAAPDAAGALQWMRIATPGWAFICGLLPHVLARYFDAYAPDALQGRKTWLMRAALFGYALGISLVALAWSGRSVFGEVVRVPWGWNYAPGPAQLLFFAVLGGPIGLAVSSVGTAFRSNLSVAPRGHRILIFCGMGLPVLLIGATDIALPVAGVQFPRLGSTSYAIFGLLALATALRFGFTFLTPREFSDEILDTLHEGVALITPSGEIRRANRGLVGLAGRSEASLVGSPLRQILDWEGADELRSFDDSPGKLLAGSRDVIPVSVSATPLRDRDGNTMGLVVVVRDLREIEELRRRVLTQARLAAVGELSAGLAHEINNPLAFVRANLGQLERSWKTLCDDPDLRADLRASLADEGREIIEESRIGVDRAAEIVRGVRRFTHAGPVAREPADLNELVEDAVGMMAPRVRASAVEIELRTGDLPPIPCAPGELRQVFLNLVVNAIDALAGRGRVRVATRREADQVVVEVTDDGCGIPPPNLERIFDPFFTTKRAGEGTGLGLGIAWNIVEAHGGRIEVESTPGAGATFRVRLPISPPQR